MSRINGAASRIAGKNIQAASPKAEIPAEQTAGKTESAKDEFTLSVGWPKQTVLKKAVLSGSESGRRRRQIIRIYPCPDNNMNLRKIFL